MTTTAPPLELQTLDKLSEEELEEARTIQNMMMDFHRSRKFCRRAGAA